MRTAVAVLTCLALAACDAPEPDPLTESGDETPLPIKARQAMEAINADLRPLSIATPVENGVDQMDMDIEIQSLEAPWRWWDRGTRIISNGPDHVGQAHDLLYTAEPRDLVAPVTLSGEGVGRTGLYLRCRADPCIRAAGSYVEAHGARQAVEAALEHPQPWDRRLEEVYFPFATRAEAERVAAAMNDLLSLQGAGPAETR
jgi:hypothetical protein